MMAKRQKPGRTFEGGGELGGTKERGGGVPPLCCKSAALGRGRGGKKEKEPAVRHGGRPLEEGPKNLARALLPKGKEKDPRSGGEEKRRGGETNIIIDNPSFHLLSRAK